MSNQSPIRVGLLGIGTVGSGAFTVLARNQAEIMRRHVAMGGALTKIEIARADPVGPFHGWRAAMPVMQWSIAKGEEP